MSNVTSRVHGVTGTHGARTELARALQIVQGDGELIYAVRTRDNLVKIGISANFNQRRHAIKGGTAEILALKPGTRADELAIHQSLKGHAIEGREYYFPTPSVMRVVNEMRAPLGLDPIQIDRRWASNPDPR